MCDVKKLTEPLKEKTPTVIKKVTPFNEMASQCREGVFYVTGFDEGVEVIGVKSKFFVFFLREYGALLP